MAELPTETKPPERSQDTTGQTITVQQATFSGPLPPPAVLKGYEELLPGAAERILSMAERQSAHRQSLEEMAVRGHILETRLGQILGFLIGVFAIGCGTAAAVYGAQIAGSFIGAGGVVALVGAFIYGRHHTPK